MLLGQSVQLRDILLLDKYPKFIPGIFELMLGYRYPRLLFGIINLLCNFAFDLFELCGKP